MSGRNTRTRISTRLTNEVDAYKKAWEVNAAAAQKEYASLRDYFLKTDVREEYSKFQPIDEAELTEINNLHALFVRGLAQGYPWRAQFCGGHNPKLGTLHRKGIRDWVKWRKRRH